MKRRIKKDNKDISLIVFIQDSSQTDGRGLAGLTYNSSGLTCYYVRPGSAAAQLSLANQTVTGAHTDGGFIEIDSTNMKGFYRLDLSDAIVASGADSVAIVLHGASNMATVPIEIELVDYDPYLWFVSKEGNNNNDGHSLASAKLTISAAASAAAAAGAQGSVITFWPGDYVETVDLDTLNLSCTIQGTDRHKCRIIRTGSGEKGIISENGCTFRNLTVSSSNKSISATGIELNNIEDVVIENCDIFGSWLGLHIEVCSNILIKNTSIKSNRLAWNLLDEAYDIIFKNCPTHVDGSYSTSSIVYGIYAEHAANVTIDNCPLRIQRSDQSSQPIYGIYNIDIMNGLTLNDSPITVKATNSNYTGNVFGIYTNFSDSQIIANNCSIKTSTAGSGTAYDLYNESGIISVSNCIYDPTKTSGTITKGGSGLTAAIQAELEENGASVLDTLQDRLTAARAGYLDKLNVSGTLAHSDSAATYKADVSNLDAAVSSRSSHSAADAGTDAASKVLATPANKLATDSNGKVTIENTDACKADVSNLDTTVSSRAPESGGNVEAIKAKTDNLPADPADDSDIDNQLTTIAGYLDTEVAAILAAVDTEIAFIKDIMEGDAEIDTGKTPWELVIKKKGTSDELVRKKLLDVSGGNITDTTTVIGQHKEPT